MIYIFIQCFFPSSFCTSIPDLCFALVLSLEMEFFTSFDFNIKFFTMVLWTHKKLSQVIEVIQSCL